MRERTLLVIAGPSAGGKTTVMDTLCKMDNRFVPVRSVTTRAPRGDSFDAEYTYADREGFLTLVEDKMLLEWAEYGGDLYGTPKSAVDGILAEGKIPTLVLNLDGVRSLSTLDYDLCAVYVFCDPNVAEQRLYDRYVGDDPSVEGLSDFVKRRDRNLNDYTVLPDMAEAFFATLMNEGTPEESAAALRELVKAFVTGAAGSREQVKNDFSALCDFALAKQGNRE